MLVLVLLLVAQSAAGLIGSLGLHSYDSLLDLDRNNGVPDLISLGVIALAALGAAACAARLDGARFLSGILSIILASVGLIDLLQADHDLRSKGGAMVLVMLALAALLIAAVSLAMTSTQRLLSLASLCLLVVAGLGGEMYDRVSRSADLSHSRGDVVYEIKIVAKQGSELVGWGLLAIALWAAASRRGPHLTASASPENGRPQL